MGRVFVSMGSNLGDRLRFLRDAVHALGNEPGLIITSISSVYETEPVGKKDQPQFLNAAIELSSLLSPDSVLVHLKHVEKAVGRTPSVKWGPREIDLDLIYLGDLVVKSPTLSLPHPEAVKRRFVLTPLAEIAPDFVDPAMGRSLLELLQDCTDSCSVVRISSSINPSAVEN
jgi:2-amino-4-hydroxy-6-hydroxymethyldihydropteridine diphosphokinase